MVYISCNKCISSYILAASPTTELGIYCGMDFLWDCYARGSQLYCLSQCFSTASIGSSLLRISVRSCNGVRGMMAVSTITTNNALELDAWCLWLLWCWWLAHLHHGNTWHWFRARGMQGHTQNSGEDASLFPPGLFHPPPPPQCSSKKALALDS